MTNLPLGSPRHWTWQRIARIAMVLLALYVIYWLLSRTGSNLIPFGFGLFLAYLLLPLVNRLERWMPRWASILVVYLIGLGAFGAFFGLIVPPALNQVQEFTTSIPKWYTNTVEPQGEEWLRWYDQNTPPEVKKTIDEQITQTQQRLRENASSYAARITDTLLSAITSIFRTIIFLLGFLIIPFWLFYVLKDTRQGREAVDRLIPLKLRDDVWAIWQIFDRVFSGYLRGQLLLGVIVGAMSFIGLTVLNFAGFPVRSILLLSLIAGLTELIPVIGPLLGAVPAILVGLSGDDPIGTGLAVAVLYILVQQIENNVLVPRIIGGVVEIHPALLMLLLVISGAVGGLIGVILVAPLSAVARDVFRYIYRRLEETDPSVQVRKDEVVDELHPDDPDAPRPTPDTPAAVAAVAEAERTSAPPTPPKPPAPVKPSIRKQPRRSRS